MSNKFYIVFQKSFIINAGAEKKKETPAQVFSCEFCEISKNTFSYRTTPVAASVNVWEGPNL